MVDVADTVDAIARPLAESVGLELLDVVVKGGGGGRQRVKVIVAAKGGVTLEACRTVSKQLARALDQDDPISDRYTLEVTSPGIDWPLTGQPDFDRVEGLVVQARLGHDGAQTGEVTGTVTSAAADHVILTAEDGTAHRVAYDQILKATQVVPW